MAYIEYEELAARYRVFDTSSASVVSSDTIYYAEIEVESALAPVFSVPFAAAHPTVKDLCIEMAYVRWLRDHKPKDFKDRDKALRDRIDRILQGKEALLTGSGAMQPTLSDADMAASTTEDYHSVHSMLGSENKHTAISSDYIDYLEDARE